MKKTVVNGLAILMLVLIAIPLGIVFSPYKAYACSKVEATTPEFDFSSASQVFYGTASKVENVYYGGKLFRMATFITDMNLKGKYIRTVLTEANSDRCGAAFEAGHKYLVYANNRLGPPAVSMFDVFEGDTAVERLMPLKDMVRGLAPEIGEHKVTLYPASDVQYTLDEKPLLVKSSSLFLENNLYVPMTFFRDTLGYVIVWKQEANRHEILLRSEWAGLADQEASTLSEFIEKSAVLPPDIQPFEANITYSDVQAKVEGKAYTPERQPFSFNGVVYVPLRETSEKLGILVDWDLNSYKVFLKDTSPIDSLDHPMLVLKLSSNKEGEPDLIVDRIDNDQALYRVERKLQFEEKPAQLTASYMNLVKETDGIREHRIRLFLKAGERENELIITEKLMKALMTEPLVIDAINLTLNRDFYHWPEYGIIGASNILKVDE